MAYTSARELFEAARDAALEIQRVERMIAALRQAEQSRGGGGEPVSHGSVSDPMARTDSRIDYEAVWGRRLAESRALVDFAQSVLYGRDGRGGLVFLADPVCADVLFWYYIMACPWRDVAKMMGYSPSQARQKAVVGMEIVDAHGLDAVMEGYGMAES